MTLRAVVFDFDFTLVDSSKGFIECYHHAAERLGLTPAPDLTSMAMIGTPLVDAFRALYPAQPRDVGPEFVRLWQERADEVMTRLTYTFDETPMALTILKATGLKLGIVSQKLRRRIEAVLERDGLAARFEVVVGGEDMTAFKPDPDGLNRALAGLSVVREEALYVGDTVIDAQAAANAGVPFVAVLSGVTPREAFAPLEKVAVLPNVGDLPDLCRSLS